MALAMSYRPQMGPPQGARPGDVLVVVHDFEARSSDELTLRRGDRIKLVELDDGFGDGWYLGKHLGHEGNGLFPGVYTAILGGGPQKVPDPRTQGRLGDGRVSNIHTQLPATTETAQQSTTSPTSPVSPVSAQDDTPQASRHASMVTSGQTDILSATNATNSFQSEMKRNSSVRGSSASIPSIQRSINEAIHTTRNGEDSPVMNETLSVIDEHITNLSTPRQSDTSHDRLASTDSASEYSSHHDNRLSYVAGPETDEEDEGGLTEAEVKAWDHKQTAQHLREIGVDPRHCDIFEEQEITGDVLLDMDQAFLYMKEYDFGVMGRRLKTWHKVRAFQESVKGPFAQCSVEYELNCIKLAARRHSSMDATSPAPQSQSFSGKKLGSHQKQPSFDRNWSMTSAVPTLNTISTPPLGSINQALNQDLNSSDPNLQPSTTISSDLDRGYFSGGELDNRKSRNVLRKRESAGTAHSRHSSLIEDPRRSANAPKRHSRFGSADSIRDMVPSVTSSAAKAYHSSSYKGRFRSASAKSAASSAFGTSVSPTVTNLEGQSSRSPGSFVPSPKGDSGRSSPLPSQHTKTGGTKSRRVIGLRAISDAVTGNEKALVSSPTSIPSPIKEDMSSPARTGSSTPSAASKSFDNDTTDVSSKGTDTPFLAPPTKTPARGKTKSKKETSAYIRGLQKKTPAEQRIDSDYSGWMKKKSSSLMTTWKPRLFILKGHRLSYYYSEDDLEERGVIDISNHRVLVADQDTITTLHATLTGSTHSPISPQNTQGPSSLDEKVIFQTKSGQDGPFFFKLVPPKAGISRAVQFTKPTIHYFQVDTRAEGRKWMGELMKATINHTAVNFHTTNKQKTISLAKARARKERPPALQGDEKVAPVAEGPKSDETGLNIRGLSFDESVNESLQNSQGPKKQSSLEAIGAYMAQTAADTGQDGSS
ncbi:putative polarized growth protein [Phaeomoniella chlamydospora]|uniref:Putative polarized growth protein n=1 Tax=Phaeomoniella chlamydospora TaxID=158046 RepID=A0A0G2EQA8_PHACM|nr:putative polarized growth protein [Phaeomoniella chlamydospora]